MATTIDGVHVVDGAGHSVQREQSGSVSRMLLDFFKGTPGVALVSRHQHRA